MTDDSYPAEDFFNDLGVSKQAKFLALFKKITSNHSLQLRNRQQFKHLKDELFEFKRNDIQMRLFAFRHQQHWYLVSGLSGKKEDDLPSRVVERAMELVDEAKKVLGIP